MTSPHRKHLRASSLGLLVALALAGATAWSQTGKLPPTSRTVYKCQDGGKTVYSDAPCLGAQRVEVEPTRGLDKSSGQRMTGADVRAERTREQHDALVGQLIGTDSAGYQRLARRQKLEPTARRECERLDVDIPATEARERSGAKEVLKATQRELLAQRMRFKELRC